MPDYLVKNNRFASAKPEFWYGDRRAFSLVFRDVLPDAAATLVLDADFNRTDAPMASATGTRSDDGKTLAFELDCMTAGFRDKCKTNALAWIEVRAGTEIVLQDTVLVHDRVDVDGVPPDPATPLVLTAGGTLLLADNTEYRSPDGGILTQTFAFPDDNFECWIRLEFAAEGAIAIAFPATAEVVGDTEYANGETYEISIKDGVALSLRTREAQA